MLPSLIAAAAALALVPAAPSDREGTYRGSHGHGPLTLEFEHERGRGLLFVRLDIAGKVDCDGQTIDLAPQSGPVTSRARVKHNGRFAHNRFGLRIKGRFETRRHVTGTLVARSLSCTSGPIGFSVDRVRDR